MTGVGPVGWLIAIGTLFFGVGWAIWGFTEFPRFIAIWVLIVPGAVILAIALGVELQLVSGNNSEKTAISNIDRDRAYVHVVNGEVSHPVGAAPTVSIVIKNTGNTNALNLTWTARFVVAAIDAPDSAFTFDKFDTQPVTFGVGQTASYQYTFRNWNAGFDAAIENGKAVFFAFGQIRYKDVFGNSRFTDYRLLSGGRYDIGKGIVPGHWGVADKGNASN